MSPERIDVGELPDVCGPQLGPRPRPTSGLTQAAGAGARDKL
jgi:hypothetical protein